ncbi:MAG: IS66 family transposase [Treponema sp.]|jgi:transposase|nr:IS66 family transposase [Treponema sp.]
MVLESLGAEVQEYIKTVERQKAEAQSYVEELTKKHSEEINLLRIQYLEMKERYDLLLFKRYGRAAEQLLRDKTQMLLFDEPKGTEECGEGATENTGTREIKSYRRRNYGGRKPIDPNIPRVDHIIDIPEEEKQCACGARMVKIGEEVSERLHIVAPRIYVDREIRPKYACRECEGTCDEDKPVVRIAPASPSIIPGSIVTPGLLSAILVGKYQDHLPFYRQELQFERIGVTISRQNMCNWQEKAYEKLAPLFKLLRQTVKEGLFMAMDETRVQVMREEGKANTTESYMWLTKGGPPDKPVVIFEYRPTRAAKHLPEFLEGFRGYLQTDGYEGYDSALGSYPEIRHIGCFSHVRRKFFEAAKASKKDGLAEEAIGYIRKLYGAEREQREKNLPLSKFLSERGKSAAPILEAFKTWLDAKVLEVPPSLLLGHAISYTLNQWDKLTAYIECAYVTPDNNACENAIRPFVVGRKNWLFNQSPDGAKSSCAMYTLIETAKQNSLIPGNYLNLLFERCPLVQTPEDWVALLPWNVKK